MAFAPDPCPGSGPVVHRLFVCEQGGRVRVFRNGVLQSNAFLNVIADTRTERGLDGICFDPNFATNHYVYVCYTVKQADPTLPTHNRVSRFTANGDTALAGSEVILLELDDLIDTTHNGGALNFGLDGMLYIGVGDNHDSSNSQSLTTLKGKLLRIMTIDVPFDHAARPAIGNKPNPDAKTGTMAPGAPWALCITPGPNQVLFAADAYPGRLYKLTLDGKVLGVFGESGKEAKQFGWIHEIACPSENEIYVAELLNWRGQKLTTHK